MNEQETSADQIIEQVRVDGEIDHQIAAEMAAVELPPTPDSGGQTLVNATAETALEALTETKKSQLADHFSGNFIGMIKSQPENPEVRGHMMLVLKVEPPRELSTFDQLKDWVEKTFESPQKPMRSNASGARPGPGVHDLEIKFDYSETELGRASYSIKKYATEIRSFTLQDLKEWQEEGKTMDQIAEAIQELAEQDDDIDWEDDEDGHDYSDLDPSGSEGFECWPQVVIKNKIRSFLESQNEPALLESIDNN